MSSIKYTTCEKCGDEGFACVECHEMTVFPEPRPLLDRKAVREVFHSTSVRVRYEDGAYRIVVEDPEFDRVTDAVMELARPMPTRDQIASVLLYEEGSEWAENTNRHYELADAVLALLNGAES
jgi:hypothetical protein